MPRKKKPSIVATAEDGSPVMEVFKMECKGDKLVIDGKALDSMRMDVIISVDSIARGYSVIDKKELWKFAKQLPAALRRQKRANKELAQDD